MPVRAGERDRGTVGSIAVIVAVMVSCFASCRRGSPDRMASSTAPRCTCPARWACEANDHVLVGAGRHRVADLDSEKRFISGDATLTV